MRIYKLVPNIEISPVDGVEDEEEYGRQDQEEPVHLGVLVVPCGELQRIYYVWMNDRGNRRKWEMFWSTKTIIQLRSKILLLHFVYSLISFFIITALPVTSEAVALVSSRSSRWGGDWRCWSSSPPSSPSSATAARSGNKKYFSISSAFQIKLWK